jgi:hypothetical protein
METTFLSLMIASLMAVFTVDTFQKRQNDLKNGKSK